MSTSDNINTAAFEFYKKSLAGTLPGGGGAATPTVVGGPVSDDAAASGNPVPVGGIYNTTKPTYANGDRTQAQSDTKGNIGVVLKVEDGTTSANIATFVTDAQTNTTGVSTKSFGAVFNGTNWDRMRSAGSNLGLLVENGPYLRGRVTADGQIKAGAGFIHTISIAGLTATPTAGLLTVYDSLTETGTVIYAEYVFATVVGHTVTLDIPFSTGCYVGFDATLANVQATISYR
jgi:hypothetical protein